MPFLDKTFTAGMIGHWHRLPRDGVESPSLKIHRTWLDKVPRALGVDYFQWSLFTSATLQLGEFLHGGRCLLYFSVRSACTVPQSSPATTQGPNEPIQVKSTGVSLPIHTLPYCSWKMIHQQSPRKKFSCLYGRVLRVHQNHLGRKQRAALMNTCYLFSWMNSQRAKKS